MKNFLIFLIITTFVFACKQKEESNEKSFEETTTHMITELPQGVEKIEPPFWWADMTKPTFQLVIYGQNISKYDIGIENVPVNITRTENPNYLFVDINTENIKPGIVPIGFYQDGNKVMSHAYEFKARQEGSRMRQGFNTSDAVYLLMPDRFANGNPDIDSHPSTVEKANRDNQGGRHGGDIQGIIDHLDYIHDLGATAIWPTPLLEDNEPMYSYHTYAQSDYYKIDPRYGSNDLYKTLADELHKRDMKLIMDYVTNHWGSKHWMIRDLPMADWIHQWPKGDNGFQRSNYRMTTQFDPNSADVDKEGCMDGWFDVTMPDMNQSNPLLVEYMVTNAIWWIEYAGLDGLRVDTYSYNDRDGIATWTKAIMDEYPNFNIVGEVWMHDQAQISFWQKDSPISAIVDYNSHCPSVMDFTLHDAIIAFNEDEVGWNNGMQRVYENLANDFLYPDIMNMMVFGGNHDTSRLNSVLGNDINKYKLALTLLTTIRGYPQLYYGDEIGMLGEKHEGDGKLREDFPGGWPDDKENAFTQEGRTKRQEAYHGFTKKLLNWRKQAKVIHEGKYLHFIPYDNLYVYFRYTDDESVMVVINNSDKTRTLDWQRFKEGTDSYKRGKDIISEQEIVIGEELEIQPKSSMIIELRKFN